MKISNFVKGISLLQTYYTSEDGYVIGAEHDQFYAYKTDKPLPETAIARLKELGWFQPDVDEGYNPEEGWSAFT